MAASWLVSYLLLLLLQPALGANSTSAGLAWPNGLWVPMGGFAAPDTVISAYYTWTAEPVLPTPDYPPEYTVPFDFIPMLWGCTETYIQPFRSALRQNFSDANLTPRREIMGFNEPDLEGQSDCTPEMAATVWKDVLEPLRLKGYRLGSPAVSGGPAGKDWMVRWLAACDGGCNPDFVAVHWFVFTTPFFASSCFARHFPRFQYNIDSRDFIEHLQDYYRTFKKPIWVTEYAVQNFTYNASPSSFDGEQATKDEIDLFMDVTRSYMESVDWVERYFWFGAMYEMQGVNPLDTLFLESGRDRRTGALNSLGVQYARSNGSLGSQKRVSGSATRELPGGKWVICGLILVFVGFRLYPLD